MQGEDNAPILNESQNHQVSMVTTTMVKTPKKLTVNMDKDASEVQNHTEASINVVETENAKKLTAKISPQYTNEVQDDSEFELEIKKRKVGRPSLSKRKKLLKAPVKQRSSSRIIEGKNSKAQTTADTLATNAPSSLVNVIKRKTADIGVITEPCSSVPSTHEVQAKTDVPKVNETPAINGTASPLKKQPSMGTLGTARKRIGGEGRTASLQRILLELPNLCDPNVFSDILIKTYASRLEASKVFECLTTTDLKEAIMKKFTSSELMALIQKNDSAVEKFLTVASADAILHQVQSREELRRSDKLLNVLLQNIPSKLSNETKKALRNKNVIGTVLSIASVDAIVKKVSLRPDLKSSEKLFNVLLQNLPEKISDETKESVVKVLIEKFNTSELVDISHEAIKMSVDKYQK